MAKESSLHLVSFPDGDDGPSVQWYRPTTEKELVSIMAESTRVSVRFVAGDTAKGTGGWLVLFVVSQCKVH